MADSVTIKDAEILSGMPVFRGTRVPVKNLIDYLSTGETIDTFLDDFPTVTREQVIRFLEEAGAMAAMKILIDEYLPRKLKRELPGHEVKTIPEAGWAGKKNGALLRLMAAEYDVFITIDNNLEDQQQLSAQPVGFIVLSAVNNKLAKNEE